MHSEWHPRDALDNPTFFGIWTTPEAGTWASDFVSGVVLIISALMAFIGIYVIIFMVGVVVVHHVLYDKKPEVIPSYITSSRQFHEFLEDEDSENSSSDEYPVDDTAAEAYFENERLPSPTNMSSAETSSNSSDAEDSDEDERPPGTKTAEVKGQSEKMTEKSTG